MNKIPTRYKWHLKEHTYKNVLYIEDKYLKPEQYLDTVTNDGEKLLYIPIKDRTPTICYHAVKSNGYAIRFVPEKYRTHILYKIAIEYNGIALQYVPKEERTPILCFLAVRDSFLCYTDIPDKILQGDFYTDIKDKIALSAYMQFTPKEKQKTKYVEAFFAEHTPDEIETFEKFINLNLIPLEYLALFLFSNSSILKEHAKKALSYQ